MCIRDRPYSGHWYFSLKDDHATLKCVMFSSANQKLGFKPENGDKVVLKGDVSVYVVDGSMPVSYTHLDVYKRQDHDHNWNQCRMYFAKFII